ncbi:GtrA-like protein [Clostridium oryzae]|uniref:GtrA-like protein n=2 Tax=Clostridium oryzae TaxID=1450648 RepID=A0A1V4IJX3_9CLOT|nr:GtrA-like protein [Clostridium oryzae]
MLVVDSIWLYAYNYTGKSLYNLTHKVIFALGREDEMYKQIMKLMTKYQEIIAYLFFGVATTIVNFVTYGLLERVINLNYVFSNTIAWVLSVLFAYITNRKYVFYSDERTIKGITKEFISFVSCRLLSGFFDLAVMVVSISILNLNDIVAKVIANVGVVILNYVFSKLFIFRKSGAKR